jgi:hypothetical protein
MNKDNSAQFPSPLPAPLAPVDYGACPFQPWAMVPQGAQLAGQAPRIAVNPLPCIGPKCAAYYNEMCLAGAPSFSLQPKNSGGSR